MISFLRCRLAALTVRSSRLVDLAALSLRRRVAIAFLCCARFIAALIVSFFLLRLAAMTVRAKGLAFTDDGFLVVCFFRFVRAGMLSPPSFSLLLYDLRVPMLLHIYMCNSMHVFLTLCNILDRLACPAGSLAKKNIIHEAPRSSTRGLGNRFFRGRQFAHDPSYENKDLLPHDCIDGWSIIRRAIGSQITNGDLSRELGDDLDGPQKNTRQDDLPR